MKTQIDYYPNLYLDNIPENSIRKIKKALYKKPLLYNVFLVCLSNNPADQLEIFNAGQLIQKYYRTHSIYVIGIASDYDGALKIITSIVDTCLHETGACNLKEYLLCHR